jgi:hypothetical protein
MAQYFLPCSCGERVRVEAAQAGGRVACACGKELVVPTLRGLKALEPAPLDQVAARRAAGRQWSRLQGGMFSLGLLVTVIALGIVGFTLWQYLMIQASPFAVDRTTEFLQFDSRAVDSLGPLETWEEFTHLRDAGLGETVDPPWVQVQRLMGEKKSLIIGAAIAAAVGLAATIGSLFMKPAPRPA